MRKLIIWSILIGMLVVTGCEDSNNIVNTPKEIDGLSLLGLSNGRTLVYIQTDTIISLDPISVTITDTTLSILITGTGNDWIIHNGTEKLINLKVASSSIIQNGYWKKINGQDSLMYFAAPPLLMERTLNPDLNWDYDTPFYQTDSSSEKLPFYYANFGFQVNKSYIGIETIITPAGEFDSYRFDLLLYTADYGNDPVAIVSEYYVPNIGLVKQDFNIGALKRSLILVNYSN